jgi:2'-5' RNA ligase
MTERLFLALWPDDDVRADVARVSARLALDGRNVPSRNLHVTLAFLGNVAPTSRACIEESIASTRATVFEFALTRLEWRRRTGIVWLAAEEVPTELLGLVDGLNVALARCGRTPERRAFRLHVTLARDVAHGPARQAITPVRWRAKTLSLVASAPGASGSEYRVLRAWPFAARANG